jgi:hypothetical protein
MGGINGSRTAVHPVDAAAPAVTRGIMSLKDTLEIGLKPDAAYRPDNLPESQQPDPGKPAKGVVQPPTAGTRKAAEAPDDEMETGKNVEDHVGRKPLRSPTRRPA